MTAIPLGTPYLTPEMLLNAPTGASWEIIPEPNAPQADVLAELTNICWRATSFVDTYCNQVLRSTSDNEYLSGPGMPRCTVDPNTGNGVLVMRRWPVTEVLAIQLAQSSVFPRVWSTVPAGMYAVRHPLISSGDSASATAPDGGWTIDVAPDYLTWAYRRGGQQVLVSYINGWPHTSLTADAQSGASTLQVDDVTGWAGASGFAYDGGATEQVSVASVTATSPLALPNNIGTVPAGPGTIALSSPLAFPHVKGTVISALPANVVLAGVWAAAAQALEAGIDAVAVQSIAGEHISSGGGGGSLNTEAELLLDAYRRRI